MFFFFGRRLRDNENYTSLYPYPEPAAGDQPPPLRDIIGVDRGEPPKWEGGKFTMPESNTLRIVATGPVRCSLFPPKLNACCGVTGQAIPMLSQPAYYLQDMIETNPVAQRATEQDLREFCMGASPAVAPFVSKINKLLVYKAMVCILWVLIDIAAVILLYLYVDDYSAIFFIIKLIYVLRINRCYNRCVYTEIKNMKHALVNYIEIHKSILMQRGVRPRPGAYGMFIEFTYT